MRRHRLINPATTLRRPLPRSLKTDFFNGISLESGHSLLHAPTARLRRLRPFAWQWLSVEDAPKAAVRG
jgi:hypothetical protein